MKAFKPQYMEFLLKIKSMNFIHVNFKRGLGIIEDMFLINFSNSTDTISFEIESNFRIRNDKKVLLAFNDLYVDKNGNELSVRRYRSQIDIEKTYLSLALNNVNNNLYNTSVEEIIVTNYGDIYIKLNNNTIIEIFNDTHKDNAILYRIIDETKNQTSKYVIKCINSDLFFE